MFEKILFHSRYMALVTVVLMLICAFALYVMTVFSLFWIFHDAIFASDWSSFQTKAFAVTLLKQADLLMIAAGLQIISAGTYKLFCNIDFELPVAINIETFADLKVAIARIAVLILLILFLEMAVKQGSSRDLLEYGAAIAMVIFAATWRTS
jgi:uncharacterized membrane protein YqhA